MKIHLFYLYRVIGLCTIYLAVGGCAGDASAPLPIPHSGGVSRARSWASPLVAGPLIYVADRAAGAVYMYGGHPLKQVGEITGFSLPSSMCVDAAQNVFVVDYSAQQISEYAHDSTTPIETLDDHAGHPLGCAVDPKSGDLAVSNYSDASFKEPGNVVVFRQARGAGHKKEIINMSTYYFPTYDSAGDLFVDGTQSLGATEIAEQRRGMHFWKILRFRFYYKQAYYLQWDGKYLALCNPSTNPNVIYEFSVSGGSGFLKGTTTLKGDDAVSQFWIGTYGGHSRVAAANAAAYGGLEPSNNNATVEMYPYPGGGDALFTITGFKNPTGVVVSHGPQSKP